MKVDSNILKQPSGYSRKIDSHNFLGAHILERGEEYTFWGDSCLQYDACHKIISVKHGVC